MRSVEEAVSDVRKELNLPTSVHTHISRKKYHWTIVFETAPEVYLEIEVTDMSPPDIIVRRRIGCGRTAMIRILRKLAERLETPPRSYPPSRRQLSEVPLPPDVSLGTYELQAVDRQSRSVSRTDT